VLRIREVELQSACGRKSADAKMAISVVGDPNLVRNEKDFEVVIVAQGQKQNVAWAIVGLLPKKGARLFDKRKLC
jgi:hypothetical protein